MTADSKLHILLVDDNPDDVVLIRRQLEREFPGVVIDQASTPEAFQQALERGGFDLVITDFQLQWSDGLAVLRSVKSRFPYRPVIMFTATGTQEVAVEALKSGLDDYIIKAPKHYVRLLASVRSVLQRTEVERRAADLQVRLEHLLTRTDVGVFRKNQAGELVECNAVFIRLLNADSLEAARHIFARDFAGSAAGPAPREVQRTSPNGEQWFLIDEINATTRDGEHFVDGLMEDITGRKKLERQQEQVLEREQAARRQAEEINRMKDDFLAVISHELRTPLTSILGWARVLRTGHPNAETTSAALEAIERNAQAQSRLIHDLLDVSAIVTGTVRLETRNIDPVPSVETAIQALRPLAEAKSVKLTESISGGTPKISADPDRLQQIVRNLIENSIKFTPANGVIKVDISRDNEHVRISVSDTGIGIKSDFLPFVFDRFRQAEANTTRSHGGMGLGLAIVRYLVELMGGDVHAHSDGAGKGAVFVVQFPSVRRMDLHVSAPEVSATVQDPNELKCPKQIYGLKVLVVDDNLDTCHLLKKMIEECGAAVTIVSSAEAAMREIPRGDFNLLISDIAMPETDGYQLIEWLRRLPSDASRIPAIALTAFSRPADRTLAIQAGYQMFINKPVEFDELMNSIAKMV